jgi:hypothetical protein
MKPKRVKEEETVVVPLARALILARIAQVKVIERVMEMEFQHAYVAGTARGKTPEEHFGFAARDVESVRRCPRGGITFHLYEKTVH